VAGLGYFGNRWLPQTTCAYYAEGSADSPTPSPPAKEKKTPARQEQAEHLATVPSVTEKSKIAARPGVDANANTYANTPKVMLFTTRYSVVTPRKKVY
jgi:hypothetical protein